jgi:hypothetical protein
MVPLLLCTPAWLQEEEVQLLRVVLARLRTQLGDGQYPALPSPSSALPALF